MNFWGGRTYTRDAGQYVWRPDHGSIASAGTASFEAGAGAGQPGELRETLSWNGPDGSPVLVEERTWAWSGVAPSIWRLSLDFALSPAGNTPVSLGSPGSNGRFEGGYGGFFWRLPECADAAVWTPAGAGESQTHGSITPWLAWSGTFDGGPGHLGVRGSRGFRGSVVCPGGRLPGRGPVAGMGYARPRGTRQAGAAAHHRSRGRRTPGHSRHRNTDHPARGPVMTQTTAAASPHQEARLAPGSPADRAIKRRRVLDILDASGRDSLLLTTNTALTWYLDGSRVHISLAGDPIAALLCGPRRRPPGDVQQRSRQDRCRGASAGGQPAHRSLVREPASGRGRRRQ